MSEDTKQQVVTLDDLKTVLDSYQVDYMDGLESVRVDVSDGLSTAVESITKNMSTTEASLSADLSDQLEKAIAKATSKGETATVVVLDAHQADWIQTGVQIGMTGAIFVLIMLAALLGVKLWECFSRGWRRGS